MAFWDDVKETLSATYEQRKEEITGYAGAAIGSLITGQSNTPKPAVAAAQPSPIAAYMPASSNKMLMYGLPLAIVGVALLMYGRRK